VATAATAAPANPVNPGTAAADQVKRGMAAFAPANGVQPSVLGQR